MSFTRVSVNKPTQEAAPKSGEAKPAFSPRQQTRPSAGPEAEAPVTSTKVSSREPSMKAVSKKVVALSVGGVLIFGLVTGGVVASLMKSSPMVTTTVSDPTGSGAVPEDTVKVGATFGVPDTETFADTTEGVLISGGLDGEGSHTLLRPGGVSQNVYLTSSVVDLGQFQNMRVKIAGETFKGQKAGWLMDVGRLEVLELNADLPEWYVEQNPQDEE